MNVPSNQSRLPDQSGTFYPDDDSSSFQALLDEVWRKRFTTFVVLGAYISENHSEASSRSGFRQEFDALISGSRDYRKNLVRDPAFLAWLNLTLAEVHKHQVDAPSDESGIVGMLSEFREMRLRCIERGRAALRISGTDVLVQRFDIDPLIKRVTPPSYEFPQDHLQESNLLRSGHSSAFFKDVASTALQRIRSAWPQCYEFIISVTRVIGYLPDADFRSCSAWRYAGVIYVSARDDSILDLEESLLHEAGHQLLYSIVDSGELTIEGASAEVEYILPWSGQRRNYYGYLHAFYIYILLAKYLDRIVSSRQGHTDDDRQRAYARMVYVISGLIVARDDMAGNLALTTKGQELVSRLLEEVGNLARKYDERSQLRGVALREAEKARATAPA